MMTKTEERKAAMLKALALFPNGAIPRELAPFVGTIANVREAGLAR